MSPLAIRPACPEDVELVVPLLHASMGGLADYAYGGDPHRPVDRYIADIYRAAGQRFSWDVAWIAEADDLPVGLLLCYEGRLLGRLEWALLWQLPGLFGWNSTLRMVARLLPLSGAPEARADEYYISNVAVLPACQNRGYGRELMLFAEQQARKAGLSRCSLLVDDRNEGAIRLYERLGYTIVYSKKFKGKVAAYENGYHRMVKQLSEE